MSIVDHVKNAPIADLRSQFSGSGAYFAVFVSLLIALACALLWAFAQAVEDWTWVAWAVLPLVAANSLWISGGAATSLLGLIAPQRKHDIISASWTPKGQTAILVTLCGEEAAPVAKYLNELSAGLTQVGMGQAARIFVLSDTFCRSARQSEASALKDLIQNGGVTYRRRAERTNKKPGNLADWLETHGDMFDYMVVLDADSRMSVERIRRLIWKLEANPTLGVCQAGISLVPGRTRFGRYQRVTSRLLSKVFGRGFSAWSGKTGNYWGHNAAIRVEAFRAAVKLPTLSGPPPLGGPLLSHDFVEAAWIRRAGWDIELCPDLSGSAEDAPQTLGEYFKRDRRWCQGNMQHVRLLMAPDLHPLSRYHLLTGIFSYLAAPIWLVLLGLLSSGLVSLQGVLPALLVAAVLLTPKLCALAEALPRLRGAKQRTVYLRAWTAELIVSTWLAPLIMLRQAYHVGAILLGRDCGWKSVEVRRWSLPDGAAEFALGLVLSAYAFATETNGAVWMALVIIPLLSAPLLVPKLNAVAK